MLPARQARPTRSTRDQHVTHKCRWVNRWFNLKISATVITQGFVLHTPSEKIQACDLLYAGQHHSATHTCQLRDQISTVSPSQNLHRPTNMATGTRRPRYMVPRNDTVNHHLIDHIGRWPEQWFDTSLAFLVPDQSRNPLWPHIPPSINAVNEWRECVICEKHLTMIAREKGNFGEHGRVVYASAWTEKSRASRRVVVNSP